MVRLLVSYMEQVAPPHGPALSPPVAAVRIEKEVLDVQDYLQLYRSVGEHLQWDERLRMSRDQLAAFLNSCCTALYILRLEGQPVGLCEFDGIGAREVELKHFGLIPDVQGRGLGPYLLDRALREIWKGQPDRVWLHTDTSDHPKAKSVYARIGFKSYADIWEDFPD
ncbi:MAG: GNAT family N-acetyltransferase [Mesorhizobium sp.]|nr:MAG: GNAT family N-acetyltransferase [Mesorhizobium sp.]RWH02893.1 MAG: GNAT family N-acetyltransferase [Mesorhizobium sp.]TIN47948.1 MAG: GNAT family N-acetyltransferase [Mesorhizobium sp.]TIR95603.1 MAG: GNAT family N-acetyltransferase [Mesorhizobium sp.]TIS03401.1 MAG: GNAT family N-acetyltransferase [Mesorhizobium sp.]